MLFMCIAVIDARRRKLNSRGEQSRTQGGGEDVGSFFAENADKSMRSRPRASENKLSLPELRTLEAEKERETLRAYARAQELWPRVVGDTPPEEQQQAEREWLFEVERLVEMFRETRRLFTSNRVMVPRRPWKS
jgi:general transcription factor 3C polypeptide 3 (transcription factor C subunit 4)